MYLAATDMQSELTSIESPIYRNSKLLSLQSCNSGFVIVTSAGYSLRDASSEKFCPRQFMRLATVLREARALR